MKQLAAALLLSLSMAIGFSGCVYKIDIQQGNVITDRDLQRIHRGMTTKAVQMILGEPLLKNSYHDDQLRYVYTMKRGHRPMTQRHLMIDFKHNRVTNIHTQLIGQRAH